LVRVLGWDSETYQGFVRVLANSDGRLVETDDTLALMDFLFEQGSIADFNVFWNVRFDFSAIVKRWAIAEGSRLKANHSRAVRLRKLAALADARADLGETLTVVERKERVAWLQEADALESVEHFDLGKYRVLYIPKKGFRLTRTKRQRGRNSVEFFDAMGWYSTGISEAAPLDASARKHLGEGKNAVEEGVDRARIGSEAGYYEAHRDAIVRYCIRDSDLTRRLFEKTIAGFEAIGIRFPRQPWSRASVGREYLKVTGVLETTRKRYDELQASGAARLWRQAYAGACILTRGVGTWDDVSKWDIVSAYPWPMPDFPSLEGAYLVGRESPEFAACFFRFYEIELTPTPRRALRPKGKRTGHLLYHDGGPPRRAFVTHLDLETFDAWGDAYTIVDAVGVVTPSPDRPLAFMRKLYGEKDRIKREFGGDSVEYQNIKIMLNGTYGILTQSRPREGRYTNFIYGAYITAHCRKALWLKAHELEAQGGTVLAFQTDGLLVHGLPSLPKDEGGLGTWESKDVGTATLFANGIYVVEGHLKKRGAPDLQPSDLRQARRPWVTTQRSGPLSLKQGLIQGRPEAIGIWETERRDLVPWRMLEESGMRVPPDLRAAPLRDYFTTSWLLNHRTATEAVSPPRILSVSSSRADASGKL
jgi:hypothetical protein